MSYGTTGGSYLRRAQRELLSGDDERLFYAALELRAGIEARLKEYLKHAQDVPSGRKRDWQIAKLSLSVAKAFRFQRVARVRILDAHSKKVRATVFYTPVSDPLKALGERLGDYLHALDYRPPTSDWWGSFRTTVEIGCKLLEESTFGQLLGPPLRNKATGLTHLPLVVPDGMSAADFGSKGEEVIIDIAYFESLADARGDAA